jgi:hypothetical protein
MNSTIERVAAQIGSSLYLRELCFDQNRFKPVGGEWAELADILLWLDTHVCAIQIKERSQNASTSERSIRQWFESRVIEEGVERQLRNTHKYLQENQDKCIQNCRKDVFPIKTFTSAKIINMVLYLCSCDMPSDVKRRKLYQDDYLGIVHIIDINSLNNIFERVGTPFEFIKYLEFREYHLRAVTDHSFHTEKWLFGRYLACPDIVCEHFDIEDRDYEIEVDNMVNDSDSLDLKPYLQQFRETITESIEPKNDYYKVLMEISWLSSCQILCKFL